MTDADNTSAPFATAPALTSLAAAKAKGRVGGRKRKMTQSKIDSAKQLLANGTPPKDVAQNLGVSVPTLYRWLPASTNLT